MTECLQDQNNYLIDTSTPETLERDFYAWLNTDYPPNYPYPPPSYIYPNSKTYYAQTNYTTSSLSCSGDETQSDRSSPNLSSSPQSLMGENIEYSYYNYPQPTNNIHGMLHRDDVYINNYPNIPQIMGNQQYSNNNIDNNCVIRNPSIYPQNIGGGMIMNCNDVVVNGDNKVTNNNNQILPLNNYSVQNNEPTHISNQSPTTNVSTTKVTGTTTNNNNGNNSQGRSSGTNQLGRTYSPGLPLSMGEREQIVALYQNGWKICDISKKLCVTHSCVSKILNRFRLTGSVRPKDAKEGRVESPLVIAIRDYRFRLGMTRQSEIREQLIADGICNRENAPSRSSINHILRTKLDIKKKSKAV
uniref:Paired domain-containing protein n=1 Tax=Parastrongyloides trichosuri TaxID=131310 RepID=A0A0N4ZR12_PARTI